MWGSSLCGSARKPRDHVQYLGSPQVPRVVLGKSRHGPAVRRGEGCEGLPWGLFDVCDSGDRGVSGKERAEPSCPFPGPFSSLGIARRCFTTYSPAEEVQGLCPCHSCKRWCLLCPPLPSRVPVPAGPKQPQELIHVCPNSELSRSDSKCSCFDLLVGDNPQRVKSFGFASLPGRSVDPPAP